MTAPDIPGKQRDIIVFDADCLLCCANASFVLRHDRAGHFALAAMQGETGSALYKQAGIDPADPETLIVMTQGGVKRDSDAVLHIYHHLGWPWRLAGTVRLIPRALRDPAYRLIARHRYRLFGRYDSCWLPSPADRQRMLP